MIYEEALNPGLRAKSEACGVICGHIHRPEIRQVGEVVLHELRGLDRELHGAGGRFLRGKISLINFHEREGKELEETAKESFVPTNRIQAEWPVEGRGDC